MTQHLPECDRKPTRSQHQWTWVLAPCAAGPFTVQHTPQCITARIARQDQP